MSHNYKKQQISRFQLQKLKNEKRKLYAVHFERFYS